MKRISKIITAITMSAVLLAGCGSSAQEQTQAPNAAQSTDRNTSQDKVSLTILAAASLTDVCDELKGIYETENPGVELVFSYGGSGALQTQIEEGAPCDVFFSAAEKQMNALKEEDLIDEDSVQNLLENKIVLIVPKGSSSSISSFEDAVDKAEMIGLGEPESVPAGQYAEEVFDSLGILDDVKAKANYGQDVRTVLTWVEEGDVDCGVVYATDAYTSDKVEIVCTAPEGSCKQVIYPAGIVSSSGNKDAAAALIEFFAGDRASELFEKYGFTPLD